MTCVDEDCALKTYLKNVMKTGQSHGKPNFSLNFSELNGQQRSVAMNSAINDSKVYGLKFQIIKHMHRIKLC